VLIQNIDSPFKWLRLLPAGAFAGWDLHPLESAPCHGAHPEQTSRVIRLMPAGMIFDL